MPAGTTPIFVITPNSSWTPIITAANAALNGTGTLNTDIWELFTAGANGSFVETITLRAIGTNIQTVFRIFLNNGATNGTAANNVLIYEQAMPATTGVANSATTHIEIPFNRMLEPGHRLLITNGTLIANGWIACAFGGDY